MKSFNIDTALNKFKRVKNNSYTGHDLTESDTRAKKIDKILDALGWDEDDIKREERCLENNTYLDYKLSTNRPIIIIEAKKSSCDFDLPKSSHQRDFKLGGVLKQCKELQKAMLQARDYAISKGCPFCVVTNGDQFVFFRAYNDRGVDWNDQLATVFKSLDDIEKISTYFVRRFPRTLQRKGLYREPLKYQSLQQARLINLKH